MLPSTYSSFAGNGSVTSSVISATGSFEAKCRIYNLEVNINENNLELKKVDKDYFEKAVDELCEQVKQLKIGAILKDSYSKRLNVLIHWLKQWFLNFFERDPNLSLMINLRPKPQA